MRKILFIAVLVIFALPEVSSGFPSGPYFPLSPGAFWTYQLNGSGSYTTRVLGVANINGIDTTMVQLSDGVVQYFTNDGYGIRLHAEYNPIGPYPYWGSFSPPLKFAEADSTLGVPVYSSGTVILQITGYGTFTFNYSSNVIPQAFETVTVPAGTFSALRAQWTRNVWGTVYGRPISDPQNITLWMVPNIGTVSEIASGNSYALIDSNLLDRTPDAFTFVPQTDVPFNTVITSNTITVAGINGQSNISIVGGQYSINGGGYTSSSGVVSNGQTVTVRVNSGSSYNQTTTATLTIGGVSGAFPVTTIGPRVAFSPSFLRFSNQAVNSTSPSQNFTMTNTGTGPLTITGIGSSGEFAQTNDCGSSLAIGANCTISVTFSPLAEGIRKGKVNVVSNVVGGVQSEHLLGIGGTNPLPPQNICIFRQGAWYIDSDHSGGWSGCGPDGCMDPFGGLSIDVPVVGDWNGNGVSKLGIYRQGMWYLDLDNSGTWGGCGQDRCLGAFGGLSTDIPVVGDWNGDGSTKIGIYRQGYWYLDLNGNGAWDGCSVDSCLGPFGGLSIDIPVVGDWNGNGLTKIGIYRQGMWYLDMNGNGGFDGCGVDGCKGPFGGLEIDAPVAGDWNGEAISRIGIYRQGMWYLDRDGSGTWGGCNPGNPDGCLGPFGGYGVDKPVVR